MTDPHTVGQLADLSRADLRTVRRLTGAFTLGERIDPRDQAAQLPHRVSDDVALVCAIRTLGRQDQQYLARVAPWLLMPEVAPST